jgi:hypothetical protein
MQEPLQTLDHWLVSYILHKRHKQSRFEIDRYLISLNYDPVQIETTWQAILDNTYQQKLPGYLYLKRPKPSKVAGCLKYGCLITLALLVIPVILFIIALNPGLPDRLPAYTGSTFIQAQKALPQDLLDSYGCVDSSVDTFNGKKFEAYTTTNDENTILTYYYNIAKAQGVKYPTRQDRFSFLCIPKELPGLMFFTRKAANGVKVLTSSNPEHAKIIAEYFPQTPSNIKVILLIQGYVERTLV